MFFCDKTAGETRFEEYFLALYFKLFFSEWKTKISLKRFHMFVRFLKIVKHVNYGRRKKTSRSKNETRRNWW